MPDTVDGCIYLNPHPDGVFPDPTCRGGGVRFTPPLLSANLLGRFSIQKRHLIAPGLSFPNIMHNFICDANDDVTGRAKGKILDFLSLLASPGNAAVSN